MLQGTLYIIRKINSYLAETTGYLVGLLMLLLVFDSFGQFINQQIAGVVEIAVFTLIASAYLGLSYTEEIRGHVRVEAVLKRLPAAAQKWLNLLWGCVGIVVIGITTYAAALKAYSAFVDGEAIAGTVPWPLYPIRTIISLCLLMFAIQLIVNFFLDLKKPISEFTQQDNKE